MEGWWGEREVDGSGGGAGENQQVRHSLRLRHCLSAGNDICNQRSKLEEEKLSHYNRKMFNKDIFTF